ncbi:glycosyltransferase 87 family protein [Peterkaempfera sp. SMS 1(5)a]|uniref:glycosyltransferase 87 family protein n=1 Tax=Peterkaempfera podocarpi TaxID=3232308 RepID=UPI003671804B
MPPTAGNPDRTRTRARANRRTRTGEDSPPIARSSSRWHTPGARTALCAATLAALTCCLLVTLRSGGDLGHTGGLFGWYALCWALFAAAVVMARRIPARRLLPLVAAGSLAIAATGLVAPPRTSDDSYRYAWDGRVQAAGISPYGHTPADPALTALRDRWLFPTGTDCRAWDLHPAPGPICTRINRPTVRTIYPPVAEGWFAAVQTVAPAGARHKAVQVSGVLTALATTGVLLAVLRRRAGRERQWQAALWAWCPAVPLEAVNNAHIDALGALLTAAGLGLAAAPARRRTTAAAGALLGAAAAVKLLPGLAVPGLLSGVLRPRAPRAGRRSALLAVAAAMAAFALAYLPYAVSDGAAVLGYLPGYLHEEGYDDGQLHRFSLLRLVLPDTLAQGAALLAVAAACGWVLRYGDPARPWRGALLVTGTAFLALTPGYPWYALLIVVLVALDGSWEWLGVPLAGTAVYLAHGNPAVQTWAYAAALTAVVAPALRTAARSARERTGSGT